MEDHKEQSPQTILVKNFFFLQPLQKHGNCYIFKALSFFSVLACRFLFAGLAPQSAMNTLFLVDGIQRRASHFIIGKGSNLSYRDCLIKLRLLLLVGIFGSGFLL